MPEPIDWFPSGDPTDADTNAFVSDLFGGGDQGGAAGDGQDTSKDTGGDNGVPPQEKDGAEPAKAGDEPPKDAEPKQPEAKEAKEGDQPDPASAASGEAADPNANDNAKQDVPPEVAAYQQEREARGDLWAVRDEAFGITKALVDGTPVEFVQALSTAFPAKTQAFIGEVLEAGAAKHIAAKHGITPELLAERLGPQEPVALDPKLEAQIGALTEDLQAFVKGQIEAAARATQTAEDRAKIIEQLSAEKDQAAELGLKEQFSYGFQQVRNGLLGNLVDAQDPEVFASVWSGAYDKFATDPETAKALNALEKSLKDGDAAPFVQRRWKAVEDRLDIAIRKELKVRGMSVKGTAATQPAKGAEGAPAKEPAKEPEKAAAKAAPATPTKEAPAPKGPAHLPKIATYDEILAELAAPAGSQARR
jgi:hypothetical protein